MNTIKNIHIKQCVPYYTAWGCLCFKPKEVLSRWLDSDLFWSVGSGRRGGMCCRCWIPLSDASQEFLFVRIGEVSVGWQEARVWRIWVNHIFISSIKCVATGQLWCQCGNSSLERFRPEITLTDASDWQISRTDINPDRTCSNETFHSKSYHCSLINLH